MESPDYRERSEAELDPDSLKPFWVSWYAGPARYSFTLSTPWWISGYRVNSDGNDDEMFCAAVLAKNAEAAMAVIQNAHDKPPPELEWRFVSKKPFGWSPFNSRFSREGWMVWPDTLDAMKREVLELRQDNRRLEDIENRVRELVVQREETICALDAPVFTLRDLKAALGVL